MRRLLPLLVVITLTALAPAEQPANSELVFHHTSRELEKLVRAHLLAEIDELDNVLTLPQETVRKMQAVAVVTARRFVDDEDWGESDHRQFFKKVDGRPFKTFRLQDRRVSLASGDPAEETKEEFPVAAWFEIHDEMFLIGLQWGRFVNMHAVYVGLDQARSNTLWKQKIDAVLTPAQLKKVADYRDRQRKAAAVEAVLGIMELETLLLPEQYEPARKWLHAKIRTPDWQNKIMDTWADDLASICSKHLRATDELRQILLPQQLAAWSQYRRVIKHSAVEIEVKGTSRKELLQAAIREELEATAFDDTILRADEAVAMLQLDERSAAKLRLAVKETAKKFAASQESEVYAYLEKLFSAANVIRINGRRLTLQSDTKNSEAVAQIRHKAEYEILPKGTRLVVFTPKTQKRYLLLEGRGYLSNWTASLSDVATPEQIRQFHRDVIAKRRRALSRALLAGMTAAVRLDPEQQRRIGKWLQTRLAELNVVPDDFDHSLLTELARKVGMNGLEDILSDHQLTIWLSRIVQM